MAKKAQTVFVCSECGYESSKWMGQCICGAWNSMTEEKIVDIGAAGAGRGSGAAVSGRVAAAKPSLIGEVESSKEQRLDTGIEELNRVLGGGLVRGSLTLISGEPGIGKSTLILQAAARVADTYGRVLYVTGEESEEQVKMRGERLGCISDRLYLLAETETGRIVDAVSTVEPVFLIIDSIQTLYTEQITSAPGSVSQVRACTNEIMRMVKTRGIPAFIVAHVTKSGDLAGPKIVEHLVDTVLNFTGERNHDFRILRSYKNRFGTTSEIGAFEMGEGGLVELSNLSESFLEEASQGAEGAVVTAVYEGTRPLLLEVQALVAQSGVGFARRTALGIDSGRLSMIVAVLEKKTKLYLLDKDIYINVTGGIKPEGTSIDLAVALAIYSAAKGLPLKDGTLAIGEIGLTGELRSVRQSDRIAKEAARMGYSRLVCPKTNALKLKVEQGLTVTGAETVADAIRLCF